MVLRRLVERVDQLKPVINLETFFAHDRFEPHRDLLDRLQRIRRRQIRNQRLRVFEVRQRMIGLAAPEQCHIFSRFLSRIKQSTTGLPPVLMPQFPCQNPTGHVFITLREIVHTTLHLRDTNDRPRRPSRRHFGFCNEAPTVPLSELSSSTPPHRRRVTAPARRSPARF